MKMTVSKKLFGGFLVVILLLCAVSIIAYLQIVKVNETYSKLIDDELRKVLLITHAETEVWKQISTIRAYVLSGDESVLANFDNSIQEYNKSIEQLNEIVHRPEAQGLLNEFITLGNQYHEIAGQQIELKKNNDDIGSLNLMTQKVTPITDKLTIKTQELVTLLESEMNIARGKIEQNSKNTITSLIIISTVAAILAIFISLFIGRIIGKPVIMAAEAIKKLASGDLTIEELKVKNRDEIGTLVDSLNKMVAELRNVIGHVHDSAHQVSASSEELAASAEQSTLAAEQVAKVTQSVAEGTESQLKRFQEVSTSVNEMTTGIQQIAESSEDMLQAAEHTTNLTEQGTQAIENVVSQMNEIHASVENAANYIRSLEERSNNITNIVGIITGIADQTNLLALNAAIEAARAGDHGKGFAVVADEVRKLAEESKSSADQIREMITLIQKETNEAVEAMDKGSEQVVAGLNNTNEANKSFGNISQSISLVSSKVQEVSASVEEMTALSEQISKAIALVKDISEKSVASGQESSAATEEQLATMLDVSSSAESLSKLAEELQLVVSNFKIK